MGFDRATVGLGDRRPRGHKARFAGVGLSLALIVSGSLAGNSAALAQDGDAPPPSAIAPYDSANFLNGEAQSSATTFKFNIVQGNANIGMSYGFSMAGYRDTTGTSESRALDLGIFPTLYGVEQCDGSAPVLNPQTFPPLTIASSTNPDSVTPKPANAYLPGYGTQKAGPFVGSQVATAAKGPSSSAYTDSAKADMVFISIEGGHSESTTSLKDHVREARSVVTAKRLTVMGGLFVFHQPRWEAVARSGKEVSATGSFTFKRATVLGIDRSPEDAMRDLKAFKKGLEDLLKPLGAKLELPAVTVNDNRVTVTPMTFKLTDPPFGAKMISPFLQNIQPLREAYNKAQLDADCKNETSLLMMDVVLGVLSGSGSIEFMAGGTEAWTDDTDFSAPPITPIPAESIVPPAPAVAAVDPIPPTPYSEFIPGEYIPGTDGDLDLADPIDFDTTLPDVGDTELAPPPDVLTKTKVKPKHGREVAAMPASTTIDESKAGTAAVAVGLMGLLGALGLTFGEHFRARRSARRIP